MKSYLRLFLVFVLALFASTEAQTLRNLNNAADQAALRALLGVVPHRAYLFGPADPFVTFRQRCERLEDAALGFVGDSTFEDSSAGPVKLASLLAARYPTHRVELRRSTGTMQSITTTVLNSGLTRRHIYYGAGTTWGKTMSSTMARTLLEGSTGVRFEAEVSFDAGSLTGGYPTTNTELLGWSSGGFRSSFYVQSSGRLYIQVRQSGGVGVTSFTSTFGQPLPAFTAGTPVTLRADFVANNGSNSTGRFYYSTNQGTSWTEVGSVQTGVSSTIGHVAADVFFLGAQSAGAPAMTGFRIYRAQLYATSATPDPILPDRIDVWPQASGQSTGQPTLGGSPIIYIDIAAQSGATLDTNGFFVGSGAADFATEAWRCWTDHRPDMVVIRSAHNDIDVQMPRWEAQMDTCVTNVLARYAYDPPIVHTTSNPEPLNIQLAYSQQFHVKNSDIKLYSHKRGRACIEIGQAYYDTGNPYFLCQPSNVHPTVGDSGGYAFEGRVMYDCFLYGTNEAPIYPPAFVN